MSRTLLAFLLFAALLTRSAADEEESDSTPPALNWRALLIGVSKYPTLQARYRSRPREFPRSPKLHGTANDVVRLRSALLEIGVPAENVVVLANGDGVKDAEPPTLAAIRRELDALEASVAASAPDLVLIHYAGHGLRELDRNNDELDGLDEAIAPEDTDRTPRRHVWRNVLTDDELGERVRRITNHGPLVWLVMDCCHSGTGIRGGPGAIRALESVGDDELPRARPVGIGWGPADENPLGSRADVLTGAVAFYAARSCETVSEVRDPWADTGSPQRGPLTLGVERALRTAGQGTTFRDLYEQVVATYRYLGGRARAMPLKEGLVDHLLFRPGVTSTRRVTLRLEPDASLWLNAGRLHGVQPGVSVAVFAPGHGGEAEHRIGTAVVEHVLAAESVCRPEEEGEAAWHVLGERPGEGSVVFDAELSGWSFDTTAFRLALRRGSEGPASLEDLAPPYRKLLEPGGAYAREIGLGIALVPTEAEANWVMDIGRDGVPERLMSTESEMASTIELSGQGEGIVAARLQDLIRTGRILELHRQQVLDALPTALQLEMQIEDSSGRIRAREFNETIMPGSIVRLSLRLQPPRTFDPENPPTYDVWAFWIDASYGIHELELDESVGHTVAVEKRDRLPLTWRNDDRVLLLDTGQGLERIAVFAVERTEAAEAPVELGFLAGTPAQERSAQRGSEAPVPARVLREVIFGDGTRRRVVPADGEVEQTERIHLSMFSWRTAWTSIRPPAEAVRTPMIPAPAGQPVEGTTRESPGDPWALGNGAYAARLRDPESRAWPYLGGETDDGVALLVDLDPPERDSPPTAAEVASWMAERSFPAEIAVGLRNDGSCTIWYDTDESGTFDLALLDRNGDFVVDAGWRLLGKTWAPLRDPRGAWLSTGHLAYLEEKQRQFWDRPEHPSGDSEKLAPRRRALQILGEICTPPR